MRTAFSRMRLWPGSFAAIAVAAGVAGCVGHVDGSGDDSSGDSSGADAGSTTCSNECTAGATQCDGNGQVTCTMGAAGCLTWSAPMTCAASETCALGFCGSHGTWDEAAPMPTPRFIIAAAATADHVYVFGGVPDHVVATMEAYAPATNTWSTLAPLPLAREYHAGAAGLDGRVYSFGGTTSSGVTTSEVAYTPATNTWSEIAPMPTARGQLAATTAT